MTTRFTNHEIKRSWELHFRLLLPFPFRRSQGERSLFQCCRLEDSFGIFRNGINNSRFANLKSSGNLWELVNLCQFSLILICYVCTAAFDFIEVIWAVFISPVLPTRRISSHYGVFIQSIRQAVFDALCQWRCLRAMIRSTLFMIAEFSLLSSLFKPILQNEQHIITPMHKIYFIPVQIPKESRAFTVKSRSFASQVWDPRCGSARKDSFRFLFHYCFAKGNRSLQCIEL